MAGIASVGWALPRLAVKSEEYIRSVGSFAARGVQEKTVAAFDEDEVTLAAEAGARALAAAPLSGDQVSSIYLASVGAPQGAASIVALCLGASAAKAVDLLGAGPPLAAALSDACEESESTGRPVLVVCADALRGRTDDAAEHPLGAGGAAFLVTKGGALQVVASAFATSAALETSRRGPDGLVRSFVGDDPSGAALRLALGRLSAVGYPLDSFDFVCGPERGGNMAAMHSPEKIEASALPPATWIRTGDTGAASAGLSLLAALESVGDGTQILLGDAEGPSAAAMALKAAKRPAGADGFREAVAQQRTHLSWHAYLGHRRYVPDPGPTETKSEGAYVSPAQWEETLEARLGLIGSRCTACGKVRHPPREACPDCGAAQLETFRARPQGEIYALTRIGRGSAPSEFARQQALVGEFAVAIVDLVDGLRVVAQVAGADPRSVRIGDYVELSPRRLFEQEGRVRYGLKAIPVRKD